MDMSISNLPLSSRKGSEERHFDPGSITFTPYMVLTSNLTHSELDVIPFLISVPLLPPP